MLAVVLLGSAGCSSDAPNTAEPRATTEMAATETVEMQILPPVQTEAPVRKKTAELRYWSVALPEDITWQEFTDGENYRVEFGMMLGGERVMLYSIHVGDTVADKVLGELTVDGVSKIVSVTTYRLSAQMIMTSEEIASIFSARMDTLEDVILEMEQSKEFIREME